jgi:hypothetical protein
MVDNRAVLRELLALWEKQLIFDQITVAADIPPAVPVAVRGLTAHAVDCARGVLMLYEASQPIAALPLVRCVLEDAVTAQWLIAQPNGWKTFISDGATQQMKALREIIQGNPADELSSARLSDLRKLVDEIGTPSGYTIQQRVQSLEGTDKMYLIYRAASALTHAGSGIVDVYSVSDSNSELGVAFVPYAKHPTASAWLGIAASSLTHALLAWNSLVLVGSETEAVTRIAARLGVRESPAGLRSERAASSS